MIVPTENRQLNGKNVPQVWQISNKYEKQQSDSSSLTNTAPSDSTSVTTLIQNEKMLYDEVPEAAMDHGRSYTR
jgi:hypothetical protein